MSHPVPPSLAFYTRHPLDIDALCELDVKPDGVDETEWNKFLQVMALAGQQAAELVVQCRDRGLEELARSGKIEVVSRGTPKTAAKYWYSWAEVSVKSAAKKRFKLYLGAGVAADPKGAVWLVPYVAVPGGAARNATLRRRLAELKAVPTDGDTSWFDSGSAPLTRIPLQQSSDLDAMADAAAAAFSQLADVIEELAPAAIF
jgi:hypothetical protein